MALTSAQQARLNELIQLVALRVDEVSDAAGQVGADDINFGDIEHELNESVRKVLTSVDPVTVMASAKSTSSLTLSNGSNGSVRVPLPADFVRFVQLMISGWKRPINKVSTQVDAEYALQQYASHCARAINPKGFLVPHVATGQGTVPNGFVVLEYDAGVVPEVGDTIDDGSKSVVIVNDDIGLENHYLAYITSGSISVGDTMGEIVSPGNIYALVARYTMLQTYNTDTYGEESSNLAIEAHPKAEGVLEELVYIPLMKAYDAPSNLKDAMVWYTTYKVLIIAERTESASMALNEFNQVIQVMNQGVDYGG